MLLLRPLLVTPPPTAEPQIPERPALAPWCRVVSDRGRLLVEHGETVVTFEGGGAAKLLPVASRRRPPFQGTPTFTPRAANSTRVPGGLRKIISRSGVANMFTVRTLEKSPGHSALRKSSLLQAATTWIPAR